MVAAAAVASSLADTIWWQVVGSQKKWRTLTTTTTSTTGQPLMMVDGLDRLDQAEGEREMGEKKVRGKKANIPSLI